MAETTLDAVAEQLAESLDNYIVGALEAIGALDLAAMTRDRIAQTSPHLAAQLCSEDDDIAAQTVIDLAGVAWPDDPEPSWWRTPVGRAVGRSVGADLADAVSHSVAAAMLGIAPGTVSTMMARGCDLDRHPDGGITKASVIARIARLG
ncbi:hypothetical protein [Nocardia ignorata]|uniref:MftR C-terminal domain-containing protein n=1 Tax=Nocardia ignorata TaxID=145285 RepID=A0A4R6NX38_NOCIG|nr:hypothetical protein [Nocardia ignorata]TDP28419.1 hypothetical protein DFR75_11732 [Nocardia ignorata]